MDYDEPSVKSLAEKLKNDVQDRRDTEISLDATEKGRPLYKKLGFVESTEGMVMLV